MWKLALVLAMSLVFGTPKAQAFMNLHPIDKDSKTGFALFRYSIPKTPFDMLHLCGLGITEVMVMSGNGESTEKSDYLKKYCPGIKIIYDVSQDPRKPVDAAFLDQFDSWVARAKAEGRKIAFRCNCGCHRTGRLAAYYRMKYQGYNAVQAWAELYDIGKWMFLYPNLDKQVFALETFIQQRPCRQEAEYCTTR